MLSLVSLLTRRLDNGPQINYLIKAPAEKVRVIEGNSDTFGDILDLIDEYEGEQPPWYDN